MKKFIRVAVVLSVLLIVGMGSSASAAGPYLLMQVDGVVGDSKIAGHKGWIDIESFSQELNNPTNSSPDFSHLVVYKRLDRSSVPLAYNLATARIFPQVTIEYAHIVEGRFLLEYQVVLKGVFIKYIAPDMSKQGGGEAVVFDSPGNATLTWTYNTYNSSGGLTGRRTETVPWN